MQRTCPLSKAALCPKLYDISIQRNGNIIQKRFRGVVEGGNIQSLSESNCLQKGSREERRLATAAEFSEEPLEF